MTDGHPFSPLIERAIELAAEWHDGTYRKGRWRPPVFATPTSDPVRIPAMAHLAAVALIVQRAGFDDETVAAAYLHDTVEDANGHGERLDPAVLRAAVGDRVTRLVLALTEPKLGADGRKLPWQARKDAYLDGLRAAPLEAVAISLADKLHNLWTTNETLGAGFDPFASGPDRKGLGEGPERQAWYYRAVLDVTAPHDDPRLPPLRDAVEAELLRLRRLTRLDRA